MDEQTTGHACRAMLVLLGGRLEPVLYTLSRHQPDYLLFFVSRESVGQIQALMRELPYACRDFDRILSPSAEILGDCYRTLRDHLPSKLAQWGLSAQELWVDYTGGTKSMSAALVLAPIEQAHRYSCVDGVERDKGGVGVVLDGRERMWYEQNPWKALAREERQRARLYFATARYDTALQEVQRLVGRVEAEEREFLRTVALVVESYRDWDNFCHRDARPKLGRALTFLKPYARGAGEPTLSQFVLELQENFEFLNRVTSPESRDETYILDLIANADRRAQIEGKYEDGVARLYSCLERSARFRLQRRYEISTEDVRADQIPESIGAAFAQRYRDPHDGKIRLPLSAAYRLLAALADELGQRFMARQEEILKLLSLRNLSPLWHGENAVGREGYERFRAMLTELLEIDVGQLPRFPTLPQ
jgi:CRISPR-associated protein (TIGR02710 family)